MNNLNKKCSKIGHFSVFMHFLQSEIEFDGFPSVFRENLSSWRIPRNSPPTELNQLVSTGSSYNG